MINGFQTVSKDSPLSTALDARTSNTQSSIDGTNFYYKLVAPAVSARYTAIQIWNPVGSGMTVIVTPVTGFNSTGTMLWSRMRSTSALTTTTGYTKNTNFGYDDVSGIELRYSHLTSLTVGDDFGIPNITVSVGIGAAITSIAYVLTEGTGLTLEGATQNVGMTISGTITEVRL